MARITGRTWLDCKDPHRADTFLNLAVKVNRVKKSPSEVSLFLRSSTHSPPQSIETLYGLLTSRGEDAPSVTMFKEDVEKELLRIISFQAESVSCCTHVTFNTSDVKVCSCDIWQLKKCYSDRLPVWSVRRMKCELESGAGTMQGYKPCLVQSKKHFKAVSWARSRGLCVLLDRPWVKENTRRPWFTCSAAENCYSGYRKT